MQSATPPPVAKLFKDAGFDTVIAQNNVGDLDFKGAIRKFKDVAVDADIAVVYYAGHGLNKRRQYLIPADAILARDDDAQDEAISLERIIESVEGANGFARILDACRNNPFGKRIKRMIAVRGISPGLGKIEPPTRDTLIAYAAKAAPRPKTATAYSLHQGAVGQSGHARARHSHGLRPRARRSDEDDA